MYDSRQDYVVHERLLVLPWSTTDERIRFREAYQWLVDQRNTMDPFTQGDVVIDNMISGNKLHGSCLSFRYFLYYSEN